MLNQAEAALSEGRFIAARLYAMRAGRVLDNVRGLHRKFMGSMKEMLEKITDMEDKGYDISEAKKVLERAKDKAVQSRYDDAMEAMMDIDSALDRATYLPFPLLNKTVAIQSTIVYLEERIHYTVRIENPTSEPLGEIIIKPFLPDGMFHDVKERHYGLLGPRGFKESTFILKPKTSDWSLGVENEVLRGGGVVLRTRFASTGGKAAYSITIENNSDQILRDIKVQPMAPGGLEATPPEGTMDYVEPFASKTIEFTLSPRSLVDRGTGEDMGGDDIAKLGGEEEEEFELELDEESEEEIEDEFEEDEEEVEMEFTEEPDELERVIPIEQTPRDFTPVEEEYNLMSMAPYRHPERVRRRGKKSKKKKYQGKG